MAPRQQCGSPHRVEGQFRSLPQGKARPKHGDIEQPAAKRKGGLGIHTIGSSTSQKSSTNVLVYSSRHSLTSWLGPAGGPEISATDPSFREGLPRWVIPTGRHTWGREPQSQPFS